jgi:hypothetical protein
MKRFAFCIAILFWSVNLMAQQEYFIFIQADNGQPFYAIVNAKTHSSTPRGNLIISRLRDTTYQITIGFPGNKYPEQVFAVAINKKDKGFQLRQVSTSEWNLFNWQNQESIKPPSRSSSNQMAQGERKTDGFAVLMANVVNDSTVLYTSIAKAEPGLKEKKEETKADPGTGINENSTDVAKNSSSNEVDKMLATKEAVKLTDTLNKVSNKTDSHKVESKEAIVVVPIDQKEKTKAANLEVKNSRPDSALVKSDESSNAKSTSKKEETAIALGLATAQSKDSLEKKIDTTVSIPITTPAAEKVAEINTERGKELVFLSRGAGSVDTVKVFISFELDVDTSSLVKKVDTPLHNEIEVLKPKVDAAVVVNENEKEKQKEIKNPDTVKQVPATTVAPTEENKKPEKKIDMINSDCRGLAIDADVDKLRIKMLAENNVDDRIAAARKYFKTKCFYTKQIKSLSELFLSDEGRYRFFDAAFPFAVDSENFKQLVSLLSDEYFVNRFKAMVRM